MRIHDLPAHDRPRERLARLGPGALSDAELLALFLRTGHRGASALDLAQRLIARFGGLSGLLTAAEPDVIAAPGMGPTAFSACFEADGARSDSSTARIGWTSEP